MSIKSDKSPDPDKSPDHRATQTWLALIIGNSQLHWATMHNDQVLKTWDTGHWLPNQPPPASSFEGKPIYFASVVPAQNQFIQLYPNALEITLTHVPLANLYDTLGIDRALALLGAGHRYGWPSLVIDGGTALTLTGADGQGNLVGGAILPGIQLQFDSLGQGTAALPQLQVEQDMLPERWARTTQGAIASGVLHGLIDTLQAYIQDWKQQFPDSNIILTGGAAAKLTAELGSLPVEAALAFWGLAAIRPSVQELARKPSRL